MAQPMRSSYWPTPDSSGCCSDIVKFDFPIGIKPVEQIVEILFRNVLELGQDALNHALPEAFPVTRQAIIIQLVEHVHSHLEW